MSLAALQLAENPCCPICHQCKVNEMTSMHGQRNVTKDFCSLSSSMEMEQRQSEQCHVVFLCLHLGLLISCMGSFLSFLLRKTFAFTKCFFFLLAFLHVGMAVVFAMANQWKLCLLQFSIRWQCLCVCSSKTSREGDHLLHNAVVAACQGWSCYPIDISW